jgi:hypothetical protein
MKQANWLMFMLVIVALGMVPMMAEAQSGAVVIKDTSCTVLDPNLQSFVVYDTVKVLTPSRNFNKNVSCHGDLPADIIPPEKAVVLDYETTGLMCCVTFDSHFFSTDKWHETITPSGNVSLTCHFEGDEPVSDCLGPQ